MLAGVGWVVGWEVGVNHAYFFYFGFIVLFVLCVLCVLFIAANRFLLLMLCKHPAELRLQVFGIQRNSACKCLVLLLLYVLVCCRGCVLSCLLYVSINEIKPYRVVRPPSLCLQAGRACDGG